MNAKRYQNPDEFFDDYLTKRGVDPALARALGCKALEGEQINEILDRPDGMKIQYGIFIGGAVRCYRAPIWPADQDEPIDRSVLRAVPGNEPFGEEWKRRCAGEFYESKYEPGFYEWHGRLIRLKDDGDVVQAMYYPIETPDDVESMKFVTKKGESRDLYIPVQVKGGRPLLLVEGSTRVLAVLTAMKRPSWTGELDIVGLPSCRLSQYLQHDCVELAAKATSVTVVLDGDVVSNPDVGQALARLCTALLGDDKEGKRDVRVGIPLAGTKGGLDDLLARSPDVLPHFLRGCLPFDPDAALEVLRSERYETQVTSGARTHDPTVQIMMCARGKKLADYERLRMKLAEFGNPPLHPAPEGRLGEKPTADDIAQVARSYILPSIGHVRVGTEWVRVDGNKVCTPVACVDFDSAVDRRLAALMGSEPTRMQHGEALHKVEVSAEMTEVVPVRRQGETCLAFAELPVPKPGSTPAWDEFLSRLSCPETFLAWLHTLTIPNFRGRQALVLLGPGHDGKTIVLETLMRVLGPTATIVDKVTGNERFGWASVRAYTRLVVLDDVRNTRLLGAKKLRQLTGGGTFEVERKGVDVEVIRDLRVRVAIATNSQLHYGDQAELTRALQVNVHPLAKVVGDSEWPQRLLTELPALLSRAERAWEELHDGDTITLTTETEAVMRAGSDAVEERFERALELLEFGPDKIMTMAALETVAASVGFKDHAYGDFKTFITKHRGVALGKQSKLPTGKNARCAVGVGRAAMLKLVPAAAA